MYIHSTQTDIFQVFISFNFDHYNWQLMKTPNSVSQKIRILLLFFASIIGSLILRTRSKSARNVQALSSVPNKLHLYTSPNFIRTSSDFKVLLLVYKSLNGLGPKYMADMLTEYKPNRPLRSLGSSQLEIPRVHTKQGESAFSYYAARSWNQLPEEIRCAKTLATFKSSLKTHLFSCAFVEWALCYVRTDCIVFYV